MARAHGEESCRAPSLDRLQGEVLLNRDVAQPIVLAGQFGIERGQAGLDFLKLAAPLGEIGQKLADLTALYDLDQPARAVPVLVIFSSSEARR